jgi:aspartyl-tRNA(Asn)/glutamyl-tRNA(Gln) amidotransferase subunit C
MTPADEVPATELTAEQVRYVARLALLHLTDDEVERFTVQLGDVLHTADAMGALDLADVPPTHHPLGMVNVFRSDEVRPSLDRDEVLGQAPDVEDHRFKVPPALGDER